MKSKKTLIIGLILVISIAIIIYNSLSQPGIEQLKTNFKEITFQRNEQNAGPVLRAYVVTVNEVNLTEMEIYGNFMPHTKYGNTKIYFFDEKKPFPLSVNLSPPFFDQQFDANCLVIYEKDGMGKISLKTKSLQ